LLELCVDEGDETMIALLPARQGGTLARSALLLALLAGCSGSREEPAPAGSAGSSTASEGGAAAGPTGAGASATNNGGSSNGSDAGASNGGSAAEAGGAPSDGGESAGGAASQLREEPAYASSVESFEPGTGAGYNQDKLPGIVLGPPHGSGIGAGSFDVVSLGARGEIVLGFGDLGIVDGPGPDLIVFENAFWPGGDASAVFYELAEVSVSEDGETWQTFVCDTAGDGHGNFPGCAGFTPTLAYDPVTLVPLDPERSGGDVFDLADLGLAKARFVKLRDLETLPPGGTTSGFDLDAVAAIHAQ
jgi:hypothetical protein